jgi:hypothetical protein
VRLIRIIQGLPLVLAVDIFSLSGVCLAADAAFFPSVHQNPTKERVNECQRMEPQNPLVANQFRAVDLGGDFFR